MPSSLARFAVPWSTGRRAEALKKGFGMVFEERPWNGLGRKALGFFSKGGDPQP